MSALTRRRALRAVAPVAGLLAAGLLVWQGSYAAFSATTNNTANTWTTGQLTLTNNGGVGATYSATTSALFGETNLKPGSTNQKCITVESTGTAPSSVQLYRSAITGTNSAALAAVLNLKIDAVVVASTTNVLANCAGYTGGTTGALFTGTLTGLGTSYATSTGTAVALTGLTTQHVVYRINWTVDPSATNAVSGSSAIADLTWEAQ